MMKISNDLSTNVFPAFLLTVCLTLLFSLPPANAAVDSFRLTTSSFLPNGTIGLAQAYTEAGGENISPDLSWRGAPSGVKSFAVTVFDPDARSGAGWWHWVEVDIPSTVSALQSDSGNPAKGLAPHGSVFGKNSFGDLGYSGPCPPPGDPPHHYIFTVYALDVTSLPVSSGDDPPHINQEIQKHSLGKAVLIGRYGR